MKKEPKNIFKVLKKIRFFLIFAIVLLSINAYAWFIYITKVDTSIKAKVRSWNIMIEVHDENVASDITFNVSEMYPGMPNYHDYATVINNGESQGTLEFVIKRVQIFDSVYTLDDYTSDQLVEMLADNYPFKIDVSLTNNVIDPGHTEQFIVDINWPYESGDDIADTYWGNQAYTYMKTTNSDTCISIMAEIRVDQAPTN
jgi:hypothetical protein